jgi:phage N-6-adenine-methyltransferase
VTSPVPRRCALSSCHQLFTPAASGRPQLYCSKPCRQAAARRRKPQSAVFTSKSVEWATPQDLFDELDAEHGFTLDVCATPDNAKCARYFTRADDALAQPWEGVCWMNPPYGRNIAYWVAKAYDTARAGHPVVCLLPVRTDTTWWQRFVVHGEVDFLKGRLRFNGAGSAPFPSAVVVFRRGLRRDDEHDERHDVTAAP